MDPLLLGTQSVQPRDVRDGTDPDAPIGYLRLASRGDRHGVPAAPAAVASFPDAPASMIPFHRQLIASWRAPAAPAAYLQHNPFHGPVVAAAIAAQDAMFQLRLRQQLNLMQQDRQSLAWSDMVGTLPLSAPVRSGAPPLSHPQHNQPHGALAILGPGYLPPAAFMGGWNHHWQDVERLLRHGYPPPQQHPQQQLQLMSALSDLAPGARPAATASAFDSREAGVDFAAAAHTTPLLAVAMSGDSTAGSGLEASAASAVPAEAAAVSATPVPKRRRSDLVLDRKLAPSSSCSVATGQHQRRSSSTNASGTGKRRRSPSGERGAGAVMNWTRPCRSVPMSCAADVKHASRYQCLLREQIDYFEADRRALQASAQGRNVPIRLGQVGIRCVHCARRRWQSRSSRDDGDDTALPHGRCYATIRGAVYYPSSLDQLYQAVQNMANNHFVNRTCPSAPLKLLDEIDEARRTRPKRSGGRGKRYFVQSAESLGIVDAADEEEGGSRLVMVASGDPTPKTAAVAAAATATAPKGSGWHG